jgi:hypothetical protein
MIEGYKTKEVKPEKPKKEEALPIFQKRQKWCFRHNGVLHKFDSESEAKEMYKALN